MLTHCGWRGQGVKEECFIFTFFSHSWLTFLFTLSCIAFCPMSPGCDRGKVELIFILSSVRVTILFCFFFESRDRPEKRRLWPLFKTLLPTTLVWAFFSVRVLSLVLWWCQGTVCTPDGKTHLNILDLLDPLPFSLFIHEWSSFLKISVCFFSFYKCTCDEGNHREESRCWMWLGVPRHRLGFVLKIFKCLLL